jgi:hypothetical protein
MRRNALARALENTFIRMRAARRRRRSALAGGRVVVALQRIGRFLLAFLIAVAGAYSLGSILATQATLSRIDALGLPVTLRDRLEAAAHDLAGLAATYLPLVASALLGALVVAVPVSLTLRRGRAVVYLLAGFVALVAAHRIAADPHGVPLLAATRAWTGLAAQGAAGAAGMYLFFVLTGQAHRQDRRHAAPRRGGVRGRRSAGR